MPNQTHSAIAAAEKESVQPIGLGHGYLPCAAKSITHATSCFSKEMVSEENDVLRQEHNVACRLCSGGFRRLVWLLMRMIHGVLVIRHPESGVFGGLSCRSPHFGHMGG